MLAAPKVAADQAAGQQVGREVAKVTVVDTLAAAEVWKEAVGRLAASAEGTVGREGTEEEAAAPEMAVGLVEVMVVVG